MSPTTIAIAAGLTIPPLIALYFLKLKRNVHVVPSTLLWKRAVEDLHVNAPFQRLRNSLLLLLQLLILALLAIALGKPMFETAEQYSDTLILMIDQSASMGVVEEGGKTRLEIAKEQAKRCVDNMTDDARAMVIAFCDRATVVSSFDSDKRGLKQQIDAIEQTQSTTNLGEAMSLAEAYTQDMIIGRAGEPDVQISFDASPATVFLFTDGRVRDAETITPRKFDVSRMRVTPVGQRSDNVGIIAMQARRHYENPEILEVAATVQNFGPDPIEVDAVVYVGGRAVDVQSISLDGTKSSADTAAQSPIAIAGNVRVAAFDEIEFGGGGVVEVVLSIDDALSADDRAWTIIGESSSARVLLVSKDVAVFSPLRAALQALPIELTTMTGAEYESADDEKITSDRRSAFDVVIMDRHSTGRLPSGNYMFWGAVPMIEGVVSEGTVDAEVIFNWDETHPILRHVAVETIDVYQWLKLSLPPESTSLIDGASSSVLAYLARDASQFLISAFSLVTEDSGQYRLNTTWATNPDFVVFMQNAIQYLASNIVTTGRRGIAPGEPMTFPLPDDANLVRILRPDGSDEIVPRTSHQTVHYGLTRQVGVYSVEPGLPGRDQFAVNLFDAHESDVAPQEVLTLGAGRVDAKSASINVNKPAWTYVLLGALVLLLLEWVVYNRRVFV